MPEDQHIDSICSVPSVNPRNGLGSGWEGHSFQSWIQPLIVLSLAQELVLFRLRYDRPFQLPDYREPVFPNWYSGTISVHYFVFSDVLEELVLLHRLWLALDLQLHLLFCPTSWSAYLYLEDSPINR